MAFSSAGPKPSTIPAAFAASVAARGDHEAVVDGDRRVSYAEMADLTSAAARAFMARGVGPGDRVAVWAANSLGWIVAALGAHSAGAAIVPVNTRWKGAECAYVLAKSQARLLCTSVGLLGTDTVAMLADDDSDLDCLEHIVLLEGSEASAAETETIAWADFLDAGSAVSAEQAAARTAAVTADDISDVLFTSGTTGAPKGVLMSHGQTVRAFGDWGRQVGIRSDDRYLVVNPFFHMFGYKAGWVASFVHGVTVYPMAVFDPATATEIVERERITVLPGAPTLYRSMLDHPGLDDADLSSLRVAVTGAADIPESLIAEIRERLGFETVLTGYGLTEAGTCTITSPQDDAETVATTAGKAVDGMEIVIADPGGSELARGETGELLVRGYSVMQGYLDDPAAGATAIDDAGFLHTGDLATMDERGYVRIVGRLKDMLIVGGFNVYPAEVENILARHPEVAQAAVVGLPDERLGEVPFAWVVPAPATAPDPDAIAAWSRLNMANYKAPRRVALLDALPLNATGKVMKEELRARAEQL